MIITCEGDNIKKDNISFLRTKMVQMRTCPIQTFLLKLLLCVVCCFPFKQTLLAAKDSNKSEASRKDPLVAECFADVGKPHACSIKFLHTFPYSGLCNEQIQ